MICQAGIERMKMGSADTTELAFLLPDLLPWAHIIFISCRGLYDSLVSMANGCMCRRRLALNLL